MTAAVITGARPRADVYELLTREATLKLLDHLRDGVMVVDRGGTIVYANPAMHDAIGRREELCGRSFDELDLDALADSDMSASALRAFDRALRGESVTIDFGTGAAGTMPGRIRWTELGLLDARGGVMGAMAIARSAQASDIAPSGGRGESAEPTSETEMEFAATHHHDLQNALSVITLRLQLLKRDIVRGSAPEPEKLCMDLTQIERRTATMAAMIDEMLDSAESGHAGFAGLRPCLVDLVALARRVAADYQQITTTHRIRVRATAESIVGAWDPVQLERVIVNLLSNAVKYSPSDTTISVTMGWKRTSSGVLAVLRVRDRGIGIPDADLPRIFDGFHRGRNAIGHAPGTGVGLMAVRRIIERHGGAVRVQSSEARGTKVSVHLPPGDVTSPAIGWPA